MDNQIIDLTRKLEKNSSANPETYKESVGSLNCNFPQDYLDFMQVYNGAEGEMEESWLRLWPIEEIEEGNSDYNSGPAGSARYFTHWHKWRRRRLRYP